MLLDSQSSLLIKGYKRHVTVIIGQKCPNNGMDVSIDHPNNSTILVKSKRNMCGNEQKKQKAASLD